MPGFQKDRQQDTSRRVHKLAVEITERLRSGGGSFEKVEFPFLQGGQPQLWP